MRACLVYERNSVDDKPPRLLMVAELGWGMNMKNSLKTAYRAGGCSDYVVFVRTCMANRCGRAIADEAKETATFVALDRPLMRSASMPALTCSSRVIWLVLDISKMGAIRLLLLRREWYWKLARLS